MKKILVIAGSDCSSGAGIQADLKTITVLGKYGLTVITSITAQTGEKVLKVESAGEEILENQLKACSILGFDAVKIGLIPSVSIIKLVSEFLKKNNMYNRVPIVLDPILSAGSGESFLSKNEIEAIKQHIFPISYLVTPNIFETEILCNRKISSEKDIKTNAKILKGYGAKYVLIKGGHSGGKYCNDFLFDGKKYYIYKGDRFTLSKRVHGGGCVFSTAITCFLLDGYSIYDAVKLAKEFTYEALTLSYDFGKNALFPDVYYLIEKNTVLEKLRESAEQFVKLKSVDKLIPEVSTNFAYALSSARGISDVAAFPGRIIKIGEEVKLFTTPQFNASSHIAKIVLTAMKYDEKIRSAINIKFSDKMLSACKKTKLTILSFSREREPGDISKEEGKSLEWGVKDCIEKAGRKVPDVIFDRGGFGKEGMIRILGEAPKVVVAKVEKILRLLK